MTDYYDDYFFTSNATDFECPNIPYKCNPTSACARDPNTGQRYCCSDDNSACWAPSRPCATDGSTRDCGSGDTSWCCLDKTEICTTGTNQINICFNKAPTTLLNISSDVLNNVFSSLSSASPSASSYIFTPSVLIARTQIGSTSTTTTAPGSSTTIASSSSPTSPNNSSASPESHASSSHLSGGAIAGIVIGSLALVALVVAAAFYFLQKRKKLEVAQTAELSDAVQKQSTYYELQHTAPPSELHAQNYQPVHELPGNA